MAEPGTEPRSTLFQKHCSLTFLKVSLSAEFLLCLFFILSMGSIPIYMTCPVSRTWDVHLKGEHMKQFFTWKRAKGDLLLVILKHTSVLVIFVIGPTPYVQMGLCMRIFASS